MTSSSDNNSGRKYLYRVTNLAKNSTREKNLHQNEARTLPELEMQLVEL